MPSQQLQGQLQIQHSVDTGNYSMDKHNIKSKTNYRQALEVKHINTEKVNKQTNIKKGNKKMITKKFIYRTLIIIIIIIIMTIIQFLFINMQT
jgi:hypothetical protein